MRSCCNPGERRAVPAAWASSSQAAPAPGMGSQGSATPQAWASCLTAQREGLLGLSSLQACEVTQACCMAARGPALSLALWPCPVECYNHREVEKSLLPSHTRMSGLGKEQPVNITFLSHLKSVAFLRLLWGQSLTCAPFLQLNVQLRK